MANPAQGRAAVGWPVILILIGLILLAGAFRATGRRSI
jgi:di/tricarboxylate transporter